MRSGSNSHPNVSLVTWRPGIWPLETDASPARLLTSGRLVHLPDPRAAPLDGRGRSGVLCRGVLAAALMEAITAHAGADGEVLLAASRRSSTRAAASRVLAECRTVRVRTAGGLRERALRPRGTAQRESSGLSELPEAESTSPAFARATGALVASNRPRLEVTAQIQRGRGQHDREHRRRGLREGRRGRDGGAPAGEGDAALWVYKATNVASLRVARSTGFAVHHWMLMWPPPGEFSQRPVGSWEGWRPCVPVLARGPPPRRPGEGVCDDRRLIQKGGLMPRSSSRARILFCGECHVAETSESPSSTEFLERRADRRRDRRAEVGQRGDRVRVAARTRTRAR